MSTSLPIKGDNDKKIGAYGAPLQVTAQDQPTMTVKVRAGSFFNSQNNLVEYAGGTTPIISAPVSGAKWVLVTLSDTGSLALVNGANQSAPNLPAVPAGAIPLAAIYVTSTTIAITPNLIQDIRPFLRAVNSVPDVAAELADRPTFTDVDNDLALKADVDGTANTTFALNKTFVAGSPNSDASFAVKRGNAPEVAIRWNESIDQWEFTNDGVTYSQFAATSGTYAPLVHYHVAADVTDFNPTVNALIAAAPIAQSQVTGLSTTLATKTDQVNFLAHANDTSIHHTLPLPQSAITGLTAALAAKADSTGGTFTGDITVQEGTNQPIALVSDAGSSGLTVDRGVNPDAKLEWDASSQTWMCGTVGSMNTILTANAVALVSSVNGQQGVVVLDAADVGAAPTVHTHVAADITDFTAAVTALIPADAVTSVNGDTGAVVLTAADVGAAPTVHTHVAADITNFTAAVTALIPVTSVNGDTGAVVLTAADVGAAPTVHTHVVADVTDYVTATDARIAAASIAQSQVTGLAASFAGKANTVHTHVAADVTDFATAVVAAAPVASVNGDTGAVVLTAADVGAAATVHTHTASQITDFNTAADARIAAATITQSQVTGLTTALAGKANTVHTHVAADVTDFTSAVNALIPVTSVNGDTGAVVLTAADVGAAPTVHIHTSAAITDFNTAVDARIAAADPTSTVATTDATPTQIVAVPTTTDSVAAVEVVASAFESATGDAKSVRVFAMVKNIAGTVTVGTPDVTTSEDAGAAAWTVTLVVSGTNVAVTVTGEAAKNIAWKAKVSVA